MCHGPQFVDFSSGLLPVHMMALCRLGKASPEAVATHRCTIWGLDFNLHSSPQLEPLCSTQTAQLQAIICLSFDCSVEFNHLTVHICWSYFLPVVRPHSALILLQFSSVPQSCVTLCDAMDGSTPGFPVHHQLLDLAQTHVHWVDDASNHLIFCCPLLFLLSIFPNIRVFSNESVLHIRWPNYWSFSFSISPSNKYSGLISFRMDWFDPWSPGDSQESPPTPQYKSINSSVLSFLYCPTLTSIHDYWKNHSFD